MQSPLDQLLKLEATIDSRLAIPRPETSYTARLAARGLRKIAQKLGEEAVETVIAALAESDERLVSEAADLTYHLTLLLHRRHLSWKEVADELARRAETL